MGSGDDVVWGPGAHPVTAVHGSRAAGLERAPGGMAPVEVRGDVHRRGRSHAEGALRVVADGPHRVPVRAVRR